MERLQLDDVGLLLSRFHWVIEGHDRGPLSVFDEPVVSDSQGIVVPSLGSLVPGWALLIPRQQATSFATLNQETRQALNGLRQHVIDRLRSSFLGTVYEFEHGPARRGGTLGCGVDQAHLHIVPLGLNLNEAICAVKGSVIAVPPNHSDAWKLVPEGADYLFVRNTESDEGVIVLPTMVRSQAIRRIIAERVGMTAAWDYREQQGLKFALETRRAFFEPTHCADHQSNA